MMVFYAHRSDDITKSEVLTRTMTPEDRKSLLAYIKDVPEWQTALIWAQVAALNKGAAELSGTAHTLEKGFADGVLRPERFQFVDRSTRKDWNTELFSNTALFLGSSLAALELLSVLADAFPQELSDTVMRGRDSYYQELAALCRKHGYTSEVLQ